MTEQYGFNPRAEYLSIVNQSPRIQAWHAFHEKQLPELVLNPSTKNALNNLIHFHVRNVGGLIPEATLPEVQWVEDEPVVKQITGGKFMVPIIEFPEHMMPVFEHLAGDTAGGLTLTLPIEVASLGALNRSNSINSQLVLLPHKNREYNIPYYERRNHEFTHTVDPHVDTRDEPGSIIMQEIVAVIGSYSTPDYRSTQIVLHPPFIIPYVLRELEKKNATMSRQDFFQMVDMINNIVYKSTHIFPKIPNDQITKRIMKCKSIKELAETWPELFQ